MTSKLSTVEGLVSVHAGVATLPDGTAIVLDDIAHVQARLEALWWANQTPDYWVITRGPEHETNPLGYFVLEVYENSGDESQPMGETIVRFAADTMGEALDQLVAWRIGKRLS